MSAFAMKELQRQLLDQLSAALEPLGFRRAQQTFWRNFPGGREGLHVAFIPHRDGFDITADVGTRHDKIEQQLNAHRPYLSEREKRQTATVGAEFGNLAGSDQCRWSVTNMEDVSVAVAGVLGAFHEIGEPHLLRFRSLEELRRIHSYEPQLFQLLCPIPEERNQTIALLNEVPTNAA